MLAPREIGELCIKAPHTRLGHRIRELELRQTYSREMTGAVIYSGKRGEVAPAVRLYHGAKAGRCENLHRIAPLVQMPCHLQMSGRPKADCK